MVTQWMEKRDRPESSLERIHELAAQQEVAYGSTRVQRHIDNLGYSLEAVCECLRCLTPGHFQHSVRYSANGPWQDVYLITYRSPSNHDDDLYIKLKLTRDCICVVLCSFHSEGAT
jgi:hypothetical protein